MRFGAVATVSGFLVAGFIGCVPNVHDSSTGGSGGSDNGSGGDSSGNSSGGGSAGTGGRTSTGGTTASSGSGGVAGSGGSSARGGSGGSAGSGGSSARGGSGGTAGSGGSSARGGSGGSASGGTTASGGAGGHGGSGGTQSSGGTSGGGGVTAPSSTNASMTGGSDGFATRYWDCCKPSCAWTANSNPAVPSCTSDGITRISASTTNACDNHSTSGAFECYDFAPWYDSSTNMSYGFAAYNASGCGVCYELQFTGAGNSSATDPGSVKLKGQQMIVQVINIGSITTGQFDLLIPGGGVGANNACSTQWGSSTDLGATYGGLLTECNDSQSCMQGKCQSVFGNYPLLLAGCNWFTGWFSVADNPKLTYKQVTCPSQLTAKSGISK